MAEDLYRDAATALDALPLRLLLLPPRDSDRGGVWAMSIRGFRRVAWKDP